MSATTTDHGKGPCPQCGTLPRYKKSLRCAACQRIYAKRWADKNPGYGKQATRDYRERLRERVNSPVV